MNDYLSYLRSINYGDVISGITSLIGLFIYLSQKNKNKELKIFAIYLAVFPIIPIINCFYFEIFKPGYPSLLFSNLLKYEDYFFTIFEYLVFQSFFIRASRLYQKHLMVQQWIFLLCALILLVTSIFFNRKLLYETLFFLFTLQAICLIISAVMKFIEIFQVPEFNELHKEPSFWIAIGILILTLCTLPFSFLLNFHKLDSFTGQLFLIFNFFYCILFILIIKAFLCKTATKKSLVS